MIVTPQQEAPRNRGFLSYARGYDMDYTFEEIAGAEKLVNWFFDQKFEIDATAPRADNDWAVEILTTAEALDGFPCGDNDPGPTQRTLNLAIELIEEQADNPGGCWWDTTDWRPTDEELAADFLTTRD
jgi:hypothetical protein